MAEIYVNSNSLVKTKIFSANEIVDSDVSVVVTFYDITNDPTLIPPIPYGTIATNLTASKSENDIGTYYVSVPRQLTQRNRKFKLEWGFSAGGTIGANVTFLDIVTPYVDLAEAMDALQLGTDPSDPLYKRYEDLALAEKWARKRIDEYTNQQFSLYSEKYAVYGDGSDILPLPYKIYEINKIYADDVLLVDNINNINNWGYEPIISESGFGIRINRSNLLDNTVYVANGMIPASVNGAGFAKGVRYVIEGTFGWESIPDNVQQATIQLIGHYFDKDRFWKDQYVKRIQSFDWHVEYSDEITTGTGCEYSDKLLNSYVLSQMVVI